MPSSEASPDRSVVYPTPMTEGAALSDVGQVRSHNEDKAVVVVGLGLAVVADGMGGSSSGDVASEEAVATILELSEAHARTPWSPDRPTESHPLWLAVQLANLRVFVKSKSQPMYTGIGTTVVALVGVGDSVLIAHAGDSRAYRLRDRRLELLTEDHSLLNDYLKHKPDITEEELAAIPRMVITRALGMAERCEIELRREERRPGDVFLLCTDGLNNALTDREIERVMNGMVDLTRGCRELIDEANAAGGPDNIGVVLARW